MSEEDAIVISSADRREAWVQRIHGVWQQSLEAIIETGRFLLAAKEDLPHGEFRKMIESELRFGPRAAQMLMKIGGDQRLQMRNIVSHLPPHWGTLYELTRLSDEQLDARIADGTIRPDMERRDISTAVKQQRRVAREREHGKRQLAAPDGKFGVIVEDFEWDFEVYSRDTGMDRHAANHYETAADAHMPEEIIERTKDRFVCADQQCCVLWMWTTAPHLAIAIDVLRLRGFRYVSNYVWRNDRIITGYWARFRHQHLLIGVMGQPPCPAPGTQWESVIDAALGIHSAKPECILQMIEEYFPTLRKIELNRRGPPRPGWTPWGLEAEQTNVIGDGLDIPACLRRAPHSEAAA